MIDITWGKHAWYFIHSSAINFDNIQNNKHKYLMFYRVFTQLIPCPICKKHFINNINKNEYLLESNINKEKIFNWTIDLHNEVNKMNSKQIVSYEEAVTYYNNEINNKLINKFVLQFIKLNINNKVKISRFLRSVSLIHPDNKIRNTLSKIINKYPPTRSNLNKWIILFLIISVKKM